MIDNRILQLILTKGIGDAAIRRILHFMHIHNCTFEDVFSSKDAFLTAGIKTEIVDTLFSSTIRDNASALAMELEKNDISIIRLYDSLYPERLKATLGESSPPVLFAKGNISLLAKKAVGFCGSRNVSEKGVSITADCARQLSKKNIAVVSGYAAGTDLAAHSSALRNGGDTIFVLAEGIMRTTIKSEIRELISEKNHVFISQFPPNITWNAGNAMKRNNVIIGLSQAMILVESGKTGGTFAAGQEALKRGCPLFVIDFAKPEVSAEANPYFIQAGGFPIRGKAGVPNLDRVFTTVNSLNTYGIPTHNENSFLPTQEYDQIKLDV